MRSLASIAPITSLSGVPKWGIRAVKWTAIIFSDLQYIYQT